MYYLNNICFLCLNSKDNLLAVYHKETDNEIFMKVKYVLPEFILNPKIPILYICSSCNTTLCSFFLFEKKCLDNSNRLNDYINILQGSNDTPGQCSSELQIIVINCVPLVKHENDIHLNIKENEVSLQHDLKTETDNNVEVKEESLTSEDSADRAFYQQLVKSESVSDDEQNGGSSVSSKDNSALDKDETNSNTHTDSQQFQCSICSEVFTDRLTFDSHLRIHINNITNLKCLICNKKFSRIYDLKRHMKIHLGLKDFKCIVCSKTFSVKCNLNKHMRIHDNRKEYECSICKNKFSLCNSLNKHMKIHVGIKDYECTICKKKFSQSVHMKRHMKIHAGIKDYECLICKQKFSRNSDLNLHTKIHAGIKDYECLICKKKFSRKGNLKIHLKMHVGIKDYECSICEKKFLLSHRLKIHMKIHAGIKDYECSICNKKFVQKHYLKRHVDTHQND